MSNSHYGPSAEVGRDGATRPTAVNLVPRTRKKQSKIKSKIKIKKVAVRRAVPEVNERPIKSWGPKKRLCYSQGVKVLSIQIGVAAEVQGGGSAEWWDKPWRSGFLKQPVAQPVWLSYEGLHGDEQADRVNHGGVDKAVCVYPTEHYAHWRSVLHLQELPFGAFGENFSTENLVEKEVCVGDTYSVGEARVQVSQPRQPCWKLARRWRCKDLASQVQQSGWTGFYFRVVWHGWVKAGDALQLLERPWPDWTIFRCNEVMHQQKQDAEAARKLSECPLLSGSWRDALWDRAQSLNGA